MSELQDPVVVVSIGNTRARFAFGDAETLEPSRVMSCDDAEGLAGAVADAAAEHRAGVLIASVNEPVAAQVERALLEEHDIEVYRCGRDVPIPVPHTLTDASTVGQDRLLNALGAFTRARQACVVVDAGTAVTVDFVDGEGTFHGGAIAPGVMMMRDALHEKTAALPAVEISPSMLPGATDPPFGKNTAQAINIGVTASVVGLTHLLIDRYAQFYEAYPRVIATGGDAPRLFENDELVEHIVPDLTLIGMLTAWNIFRSEEEE